MFFLGGTKGKQHESICASILVENIYLFLFRGDRVWDRDSVREAIVARQCYPKVTSVVFGAMHGS